MNRPAILSAVCHWLNGDPAAAADEGYSVDHATIDGDALVVTLVQVDRPRQIRCALRLMEVSVPAAIRDSSPPAL